MKWQPFTRYIKERGHMLFWDGENHDWFSGNLLDDEEYGLVIDNGYQYVDVSVVTHYLIVNLPA